MKKVTAAAAIIVIVAFTMVFAGGCLGRRIAEKATEKVIEKAIEEESGEDVDIDLDDGEINIQGDDGEVNISADDETVEIESDEGQATIGAGADLPDDFPAEVPVYGNMDITSSMSGSGGDGQKSFTVTGLTQDDLDTVKVWYESQLEGWEITGQFSMDTDDGKNASINAVSGDHELSLMIAESDEGTVVVIAVAVK